MLEKQRARASRMKVRSTKVYRRRGPLASDISQVSRNMHSLCRARHFTSSSRKAENIMVKASASRLRMRETKMTAKPFSS